MYIYIYLKICFMVFERNLFLKNQPIRSAGRSRLGELLQGADAVLWEVLNRGFGAVACWCWINAVPGSHSLIFLRKVPKNAEDAEKHVEYVKFVYLNGKGQ